MCVYVRMSVFVWESVCVCMYVCMRVCVCVGESERISLSIKSSF